MCVCAKREEFRNGAVRHPQSQGCIERFNQTLKTSLLSVSSAMDTDWDKVLPQVLDAYNKRHHSTTGRAPDDVFALKSCNSVAAIYELDMIRKQILKNQNKYVSCLSSLRSNNAMTNKDKHSTEIAI